MWTVISCDVVRSWAARTPFEFATAMVSTPVANEPYATTPASSAAPMTARAAAARNSGVALAVASANAAGTSRMGVGSGRPAQSSSSATLRAIAAAFDASRRSPSSSTRPLDATPIRRPATNRRLTLTFVPDGVARAPELVRDPGVRGVLQQPALLAALDLVGDLGGELEVEPPVVDRPAAIRREVEPVVRVGNDLVEAHAGLRQQVDVRHP